MDKKEIEKIIDYVSIKGCFNSNFKGYSKMYAMTTENISGFLNKHDLNNKKVLTVAGSGDQRYNAYLRGAREVICFDVNPMVDLHLRLKEAAMNELEWNDFLKFFGVTIDNKSNCFLDNAIFNKFKKYLDKDVYLFYDFLINKFRRHPLGDGSVAILEWESLNTNVINLPEVLDGEKFDMILLSNISDYVHFFYPDNHMKKYRELIDKLVDNLYDGGIIQIGYIYAKYDRGEDTSKFRFPESRNKVFPFTEYPVEFVNSFYNKGTYDKVITYQKK